MKHIMFLKKTKQNKTKQIKTKTKKNKTKLLRQDSHSQCQSAGVAKQRLYDHGYDTMITFVSFVFFFVVYIKVYLM